MIYTYYSNDLEILKSILSSFMKRFPIRNAMCNEIIIVNHQSMMKWLKIKLAYDIDIVLNIDFLLVNNFIWNILKINIKNLPHDHFSFKTMLMWYIVRIILNIKNFEKYSELNQLLKINNQYQIFYFANKLSDLYFQYLIFRPDWISLWEQNKLIKNIGKEQIWQSVIWKKLVKKIKKEKNFNISNIYQMCVEMIKKSLNLPQNHPKRIFLFNVSFMPPIYLRILEQISMHLEVHLFFVNPSYKYWSDIQNQNCFSYFPKSYTKKINKSLKKISVKYSLLASWGKSGSDYLLLLENLDYIINIEAFYKRKNNTLLNYLKNDILKHRYYSNIQSNSLISDSMRYLDVKDNSIYICECNSIYNEIELLYIYLLDILSRNHHISPRDIIVMSIDIEKYAQAIQSVFNKNLYNIHANISDRKILKLHPILSNIFNLLKLPKYTFSVEQIFSFLECSAIANRYRINSNELKILKNLITHTEIRWGLNSKIFQKNHPNCISKHTWTENIKQILYEYAMTKKENKYEFFFKQKYNKINIFHAVGKLSEIIDQITIWYEKLSCSRELHLWKDCINEIICDFFQPNKEEKKVLKILKKNWSKIILNGEYSKYNKLINIEVLSQILFKNIDQEKYSQKFLSGNIDFCNFSASKTFPYKVICLLGMNDNVYPKSNIHIDFDLMYQSPRFGDQNCYDEDRYAFLKILLSAKNNLYISFLKNSIQADKLQYSSVIINELLEYIAVSFRFPNKNITSFLENFFLVKDFLIKKNINQSSLSCILNIQNYHQNLLKNNQDIKKNSCTLTFRNKKNKYIFQILINKFLEFYTHPIRFWCKYYLNINFSNSLNYLHNKKNNFNFQLIKNCININLFRYFMQNYPKMKIKNIFYEIKNIPYGKIGMIIAEQQCDKILKLVNMINKYKCTTINKIKVCFECGDVKIMGFLFNISKSGLLRWNIRKLSLYDGLLFWIEHLLYCISGGIGDSYFFGIESHWHYTHISQKKAKELLYIFIIGYQQGTNFPLTLLNKCGSEWIINCFNKNKKILNLDKKSQNYACTKLINAWNGNMFISGESKDPYICKVIPCLTKFYIDKIIKESKKYLIFPLKFHCSKQDFY
ncbi:exodeoxyribonuclease V gamma chain [Wigglesworthia glossinidia endosymbiont of Glossina morsitans morsitans (Yale colony)]|uniref:RecBCD enzyme subunit RecC n=1 Tax=Wigglesworthia glossinidia endosymbiont of Glossina morsitans morsitans (Yale colony) TaxID=1142511 RepID=H6Q550_WIGGL|nr:exodeoxyribonuclease V subunit gamma [Wigglesworthia glossinidia]AFA41333.1 exodeoxyribonuclease V gamma chain [Wigglesworthia glossinidia endosymbiont of Glossina morsitans morsitans (Yale colony)]